MRVAYVNVSDPNQWCPQGFSMTTFPKRACRKTSAPGCTSIPFTTHDIQYSKVCGRIIGYQYGRPNAFTPYNHNFPTIDENYVDGVSITYGTGPRKHIWTFAAENGAEHANSARCPCRGSLFIGVVPPYVGNDYFCEMGSQSSHPNEGIFYHDDPLWDGRGCGPTSSCCSFNSPPWFCKELLQPTTDDIEVRGCTDQDSYNEDIPIELIELYVQ